MFPGTFSLWWSQYIILFIDSNTDSKFIVLASYNFMLILDVKIWKWQTKIGWQNKCKLQALYFFQTILFDLHIQDLSP